jgi:release factor glutamine methyltransferase
VTSPAPAHLVARLRAAGCVYAEDEAGLIVAAADGDAATLDRLVAERVAGRPLEHLLGWADFDGLRVHVTDGVFVPRQRTRLLVDLAEQLAPDVATVVDLCCGTGALLAALAVRRPDVVGHAADLDPDAVGCARRNLAHLDAASDPRVHEGDLFDALPEHLRGRVDVLLVNAPYVPTEEIDHMPPEARDHEHRVSLDGGGDGLDVHRRVVAGAAGRGGWLAPGGVLLVEVAPMQVDTMTDVMAAAGLQPAVAEEPDLDATAVIGRARGVRSLP